MLENFESDTDDLSVAEVQGIYTGGKGTAKVRSISSCDCVANQHVDRLIKLEPVGAPRWDEPLYDSSEWWAVSLTAANEASLGAQLISKPGLIPHQP